MLHHYEELGSGQLLKKTPIIRIAGCQDKRIHVIGIKLSAGPGSDFHICQGLTVLKALDENILHRNGDIVLQHIPGGSCMDIIEEDDLVDLGDLILIKASDGSA